MKAKDPVTGHSDYTGRRNVVKWWPWWKTFAAGNKWEQAVSILEKGQTKFLDRRDRLGMIQVILRNVDQEDGAGSDTR